jgi:outer membrane protein insertion porin family
VLRTKRGAPYDDFICEQDRKAVVLLYKRRGFLDARVVGVETELDAERDQVKLTLRVSEGPQVRARSIEFSGNTIFPSSALRERVDLRLGDPLNDLAVDFARLQIASLYADLGYIYTQVSDTTIRSPGSDFARIVFRVEEGARAYVGGISIRFLDESRVRSRIVQRELTFHPGEPVSMAKIRESRQKVYATGLFREAGFRLQGVDVRMDTIGVLIELRREQPHTLALGLSWQPPAGAGAGVEWGCNDLFGNAQSLRIQEDVSYSFRSTEINAAGLESVFGAEYVEPYFLGSSLKARSRFFIRRDIVEQQVYTRTGAGLQVGKYIGRSLQSFLGYKYEYVRQDGGITSSLIYSLTQDTRDNIFDPSDGLLQGFNLEHAGGSLGGENDFDRARAQVSAYHRPLPRVVTVLHAGAGWLGCYGRTRSVPPYERFELAQATAVRGYEEIALSDTAHEQEIMVRAGGEVRFHLYDVRFPPYGSFQGALFLDAGNIQSDSKRLTLGTTSFGTGFGVRYLTAIGPVRFDYGLKLERAIRLNEGRWYIGLGHAF